MVASVSRHEEGWKQARDPSRAPIYPDFFLKKELTGMLKKLI
jgi:hypothetical protein